jgi:hypothetical protein
MEAIVDVHGSGSVTNEWTNDLHKRIISDFTIVYAEVQIPNKLR